MEEQEQMEQAVPMEEQAQADQTEKQLSLHFYIPFEDFLGFHHQTMQHQSKVMRKRAIILGCIELVAGLVFLGVQLFGGMPKSTLTWIAAVLLVFLGAFQILHYIFLYDKTLERTLRYQYDRTDYFKEEVHLDFYPNKVVEHLAEGEQVTYWHTIYEVQENEQLLMLMLEPRRCMLIPKSQVQDQWAQLDALMDEVCANFEKERRQI